MSCFSPNDGYLCADVLTGELIPGVKIASTPPVGAYKVFKVPCQQCRGCRKSKVREKAIRCMHEARMHHNNCFLTLTYNDENISYSPSGLPTLVKSDFINFLRRTKDKFPFLKIRYFYCGEYGPKYSRPHYHALIFGLDFVDKYFWKREDENDYFRSPVLESLWTLGFCIIGNVTYQSAAYVASYVTKKLTGKASSAYGDRLPEFSEPSRRPGIGHGWFNKYKRDVYPSDSVIVNAKPFTPPRYYDKLLSVEKPALLERLKKRRVIRAERFASEQTFPRRQARSLSMQLKQKRKTRVYENE